MRLVVWGINYAPEVVGIAPHNVALCEFARQVGHDVEMVTTFRYYPEWKKRPEDKGRVFRTDVINDVPVHRCWHYVPERATALKRIIHEGTFVLFSTLRILALPKPDVYVVVSPPLLLGMAAWLVSLIKGAPFVFHVKDLQPDAAVSLGMLREGWFTRVLYWLEAFAYKKAARVCSLSDEVIAAFRSKGVPEEKLILYQDSVVIPEESQLPARGEFRKRHGFGENDFLAVYSGNLGVKQGLDILVEAAHLLRGQPNIRFLICGDGAARPALESGVRQRQLENVLMLPLQSDAAYAQLLVDADVSFITQQARAGNAFFPSKLLMTAAHLCPVVTVADEESALAGAVRAGGCGVNVPPGRARELANVVSGLAQNPAKLREWGQLGRRYVEKFERRRVQEKFLAQMQALIG
jgi:colanic acid biosynthesis glycosyl transferase WcaI